MLQTILTLAAAGYLIRCVAVAFVMVRQDLRNQANHDLIG